MRYATLLVVGLLLAGPALADERVELADGSVLVGRVISMNDDHAVVETAEGTFKLAASTVRSVRTIQAEATASRPAARAATGQTSEQTAAATADRSEELLLLSRRCHELFRAPGPQERAAGITLLLDNWPLSEPVLDQLLADEHAGARLEATRILAERKIPLISTRLAARLRDKDPLVRMMASRVVRQRGVTMLEAELGRLMHSDPDALVRIEALRSLEDVGSVETLPVVLDALRTATTDRVRSRARGILARVLGTDLGADVAAWQPAVAAAVAASRGREGPRDLQLARARAAAAAEAKSRAAEASESESSERAEAELDDEKPADEEPEFDEDDATDE